MVGVGDGGKQRSWARLRAGLGRSASSRPCLDHEGALPGGLRLEAGLRQRRQPLLPVVGRQHPGGGGATARGLCKYTYGRTDGRTERTSKTSATQATYEGKVSRLRERRVMMPWFMASALRISRSKRELPVLGV